MFKEIYVANYKPFKELRLPLSRVNLLIGPNNSGKTSVLEAIMLMKRLFVFGESPSVKVLKNVAPAEFFGDDKIELDKVVHKKDFSKELRFGCTVELGDKEVTKILGFSSERGTCEAKIGRKTLRVEHLHDKGEWVVKKDDFNLRDVTYNTDKVHSKPDLEEVNRIKDELRKVFLIHSGRGVIKSYYRVPPKWPEPEEAGVSNAFDVLYYIRYRTGYEHVIELINDFIKKYGLEDIRSVPAEEQQYEVIVRDSKLNIDINISQIGSGIDQLLLMLILLNYYPDESLVLMELPEIHMHPRMQSEFANLLNHVLKGKNHKLIIETHSEHLIYGLLNLVAKKKLSPSDVNLLYFRRDDGVAECGSLEVTEMGTIRGGLPDFFEADLENLLEWISTVSEG